MYIKYMCSFIRRTQKVFASGKLFSSIRSDFFIIYFPNSNPVRVGVNGSSLWSLLHFNSYKVSGYEKLHNHLQPCRKRAWMSEQNPGVNLLQFVVGKRSNFELTRCFCSSPLFTRARENPDWAPKALALWYAEYVHI